MYFALALLIKPFLLLFLSVTVLIPAKLLVQRRMKEGRLKRILLHKIS